MNELINYYNRNDISIHLFTPSLTNTLEVRRVTIVRAVVTDSMVSDPALLTEKVAPPVALKYKILPLPAAAADGRVNVRRDVAV
jgi:hypothetical protein